MTQSHPKLWEMEPQNSHYIQEMQAEGAGVTPGRFVKAGTAITDMVHAGAAEYPLGLLVERLNPAAGANVSEFSALADNEWGRVLRRANKPVLVETDATSFTSGQMFTSAAGGKAAVATVGQKAVLAPIEIVTATLDDGAGGTTTKRFVRGLLLLPGSHEVA